MGSSGDPDSGEIDESDLDSIAAGWARGPDGVGSPIPPTLEQLQLGEQDAVYDGGDGNLLPRY